MNQAGQDSSQPSPIQTSTPQASPKSPLKVIIIVVLLAIVVGGGYAVYSLLQPRSATQKPASGTPLPRTDQNGVSTPHYVGSQTITLSNLTEGLASGTASRNVTQDNFSYSVNATLPELLEGQFYQVWVINAQGGVFSVGKLSQNQDGSFSLEANYELGSSTRFTISELHNVLVVTTEATDDEAMETKILEGNFTK